MPAPVKDQLLAVLLEPSPPSTGPALRRSVGITRFIVECRDADMHVRLANDPVALRGPPSVAPSFPHIPGIGRSSDSPSTPFVDALSVDRFACPSQSCLHHDSFRRVSSERRAAGMCALVDRPAPTTCVS